MQLRGIDFGHAFCSSGARNFTGRGWPHHRQLEAYGLAPHYDHSTLIGKTFTLYLRAGNMPLQEDGLTPRDKRPDCVIVKPWKGVALNAVGLTNFGAEYYLRHPHFQEITDPFVRSFMCVAGTREERLNELKGFIELLHMIELLHVQRNGVVPPFQAPIAIQENFSCPNTEHGQDELMDDVVTHLNEWRETDFPVILKFNVLASPDMVAHIAQHPACDAISVSNTIPWGALPERIDWAGLFGVKDASPESSPLANYGGGGLSGKPLLPLVEEWITAARPLIKKPIMGGGGVLCKKDATRLLRAGANAIELGSVSMLRPWRVQGIIHHINRQFAIERRP